MGRVEHAIFWHVYPLGFTGAPRAAGPDEPVTHRLRHVEAWLDYLIELGCNGLQLGPVFASSTHGYDTVDHLRIDPRLGDDADFDRLIAACRERGIAVLLDGVFHHVGRDFPRFRAAERGAAEAAAWFRRTGDGGWATFEGHDALVALDHGAEAVREHVTTVMNHWLDRGAAGWRLDAAYAVPPEFWQAVLPAVRERHPSAWIVGEVIHGLEYREKAGLDAVTQYELWKAIWSALNDANLFELAWALGRHSPDTLTFVGNHDVTRIASRLDDPGHLGHALAVLFTVAGVPSVYYGDEQAFRGVKYDRAGGDDDVRPAFPASPAELAPFGAEVLRTHQRLIGLRRRFPWLARAETTVTHLTNRQIALRAAHGGQVVVTSLNLDDVPYRFPAVDGELTVAESSHPGQADPLVTPGRGWTVGVRTAD
ncbi:alpha-amylase family protein [Catenuloplanes atrovinosus]|uniref:Glycosidase n=1 Tax=Catenuloplanes atrovinosus TaxID=137266 RepID=A0AAE4C882_9ACTN|nr:alpha-amylase family protein [Catenuloplanes atrovinosus]MDR7273479.1 glycosidase [Catenuloplanes atrovinosus]